MTFAHIKHHVMNFVQKISQYPTVQQLFMQNAVVIATAETAAGDVAAGTRMQDISEKLILGSCCPSQMIAVLAAFQQVPP